VVLSGAGRAEWPTMELVGLSKNRELYRNGTRERERSSERFPGMSADFLQIQLNSVIQRFQTKRDA